MMKLKFINISPALPLLFLLAGCGGEVQQAESIPQADKMVSESTNIYTLGNKVFIIPSPVQTMQLFKKINVKFDKSLLNNTEKSASYKSKFEKGVNIGIFGGDLGFIVLNEQSQEAIAYLGIIKKLAEELGAAGIFDAVLMGNLEKSLGNQSELLKVVTMAYQKCDGYFKENNQADVGAMMIAGGWLESIHFTAFLAKTTKDPEILKSLGEQKQSLDNLLMLVSPYYSKKEAPQYSAFVDDLTALQNEFKDVHIKYQYKESTIDAGKKTAVINSTSDIVISDMTLERIVRMVEMIRTKIIENKYQVGTPESGNTTTTAGADTTKK
ncbi:MAG: hypothetical protein HYY40_02820 [Bacteroidetes bacterium]|nr:hypothetical protein [Bacteroidota bacterium]